MKWHDWSSVFPLLGFFGEQAVRLLRESWDGILKADPKTGEIRPQGATALAEELFAMLDDNIPQQQNGPVTMNPPAGVPALTINSTTPGNSLQLGGDGITLGGKAKLAIPPGGSLDINGGAINVKGSINLDGGFYNWNGVPLTGGGTGTNVFLAKVVSGSGDTYKVDIYGQGLARPATATGITATVPQIDPGETIPAGYVVPALYKLASVDDHNTPITVWQFQPAVWVS